MGKPIEESTRINFPAIVCILNDGNFIINQGKQDGVVIGNRILVYRLSDREITDPFTGENLGLIEMPKGEGKIINVQEKISTAKLDRSLSAMRAPEPISELDTYLLVSRQY